MFGRKPKFEPDGVYDGYSYKVLRGGKVDVDINGKIVRFSSIDDMIPALEQRALGTTSDTIASKRPRPIEVPAPRTQPPKLPLSTPKKKRSGCGCLTIIIIALGFVYLVSGNSDAPKIAEIINSQFGRVCEAKVEGLFSNTLRLDWTGATTKLNVITVMAAIGKSKETLYSKGIRYLKFPNDAGGYNIIDWKTGEKSSVEERARYHF